MPIAFCFQTYDYQEEMMSLNEIIEELEQQLLDEISKLSPEILHKTKQRHIGNFPLEASCIFILPYILQFKTLCLTDLFFVKLFEKQIIN